MNYEPVPVDLEVMGKVLLTPSLRGSLGVPLACSKVEFGPLYVRQPLGCFRLMLRSNDHLPNGFFFSSVGAWTPRRATAVVAVCSGLSGGAGE